MKALAELAIDLMCFGGIALLSYGAWLTYRPLGYMVLGAGLLAFGAFFLRVHSRKGSEHGRTIDDARGAHDAGRPAKGSRG